MAFPEALYLVIEALDESAQRRWRVAVEVRYTCLVGLRRSLARNGRDNFRSIRSATIMRIAGSLVNHRKGLSVFVDRPQVPLDNNLAERLLRGPAIGRRLSFGSDSETGARFTALMYSVIGTLTLHGIDVPRWLKAWLTACAENGGRPPDDLSPWLPWARSAGAI